MSDSQIKYPVCVFILAFGCWLAPPPTLAQTMLVARGAQWKYLDNGSDQGIMWRDPNFDDSGWVSGPAQLGYGDGDEATVVSFGPDPNNKYITTYFRHTFEVRDPSQFAALPLAVLRDDGAVVYLNGVEVFRTNMPEGEITYTTRAFSAVAGAEERAFFRERLDGGLLQTGINVVAVEIHQVNPLSSDISFDLELFGTDGRPLVTRGPYLQTGTSSSAVVIWKTDILADGRVWYGRNRNRLTQFVDDPRLSFKHSIELNQLTPGKKYFYAIGTTTVPLLGGNADHFFRTAPAAGSTGPTRIWVIGDSGTGGANAAAVRDAYIAHIGSRATDIWLMLGDNAYGRGPDP
ncbi:MAG: hypothetical protein IID33_13465, partial [Planctomycetes bacterium]|nr:hypothetical protein [Planctomycetota bacterium]